MICTYTCTVHHIYTNEHNKCIYTYTVIYRHNTLYTYIHMETFITNIQTCVSV